MITEKRRHPRFSGRVSMVSADEDGLNFSFIRDLSRDGAYIETEKLLPEGATFHFCLTNGKIQLPVRSKVIRVRDAFFHGGCSGMGVHFETLDAPTRRLRDDLLLYLMSLRYQEMWAA